MGVKRMEWNGEEAEQGEIADKLHTMCVRRTCSKNIIFMDLTSEDEEIIQYDGACSSCGLQYHVVIDKDAA